MKLGLTRLYGLNIVPNDGETGREHFNCAVLNSEMFRDSRLTRRITSTGNSCHLVKKKLFEISVTRFGDLLLFWLLFKDFGSLI